MRSIPSAPTLAPWSRTVGRPICWWSRATSRGWSRRSTGSVSRRFPPAHRTVDRGHGRIEQRTTWVAPAPPGLNFPHAAQVVIVQRHTTDLAGKHPRTELVYAVTCLTADQADAERLGALLRAHWQVEGLHWVRDVTFAEDASRIRPARVRRSWPPCATWPSGCYGRLDRPGSLPGYATSVVILPARWRSSAFHELPRTPQTRSSRGPVRDQLWMLVSGGPLEAVPDRRDLPRDDLDGPARLDVLRTAIFIRAFPQVAGTRVVCADLVPDRHLPVVEVGSDRRLDDHGSALADHLGERRVGIVDQEVHSRIASQVMGPLGPCSWHHPERHTVPVVPAGSDIG